MLMKRVVIILILCLLFLSLWGNLSDRPEQYLQVDINSGSDISILTDICSIDRIEGNTAYVYALPEEVDAVIQHGFRYKIIPFPYENTRVEMATTVSAMSNWNMYPTFPVYSQMMNNLATNYPAICQVTTIGNSVQGRAIYVLKISDNVTTTEAEPEVYFSSTMHGDETTGWINLLRFAYELCESYGTDAELTNLVNSMEIYINPLANPDGTYYGGDSTVNSARRYNINNIDLNRNYIDAATNTNGDYNLTAIENLVQMNFASAHNLVLSANYHGGAEVANYPWDTWADLHVDDAWWQYVSRNYATSLQNASPAGYFDDENNGITNGYAWYEVNGSRQDWMNYFNGCREITFEVSATKMVNNTLLPNYYNYNHQAMIDYLKEAGFGIRGIITDIYGNPLEAEITINNHDDSHSTVWSNPDHGDYYRPIAAGTYTVTVRASGYEDQVFSNVTVVNGQATTLNATFGTLGVSQNIDLNSGWNLISMNTEATDMSPANLFSAIQADVIQVKSLTQTYDPSLPSYFNTLSIMNNKQAYWVNMNNPATLTINGDIADDSQVVALSSGWNMLGYLLQDPLAPATALQSILANLGQIKNLTQTYDPSMPSYFNTLTQMIPGQGYWINMLSSASLVYNSITRFEIKDREDAYWLPTIYPNNTATAYITINGLTPAPGDLLGAFGNGECLGTAHPVQEAGATYATMLIQIPDNDTSIAFGYHFISTDEVIDFTEEITVSSGETYNLILNTTSANDNVHPVGTHISVYPNPMSTACTIISKSGFDNWKIFNLKGQLVKELRNSNQWNGMDSKGNRCPNGIYFLRSSGDTKFQSTKLILMR
jgi:predicted deacylase